MEVRNDFSEFCDKMQAGRKLRLLLAYASEAGRGPCPLLAYATEAGRGPCPLLAYATEAGRKLRSSKI